LRPNPRTTPFLLATAAAFTLLQAGFSHAALLQAQGPSTSVAFDTQLTNPALIYDANYYAATTGRLLIVAQGSTLRGPGVPGSNGLPGTAPSQLYLSAGDTLRDVVLSLQIDNRNGQLLGGSVLVPADNNAAASGLTGDSWTMAGTVNAFGWSDYVAAGTNTFDLAWTATQYDFSDVAANPGLVDRPVSCNAANSPCGFGYMRFATTGIAFVAASPGAAVDFRVDWVRGGGVISGSTPNAQLGTFDDGIAASAYANNAVSADVFLTPVPVPAPLALMAMGLAMLVPLVRRRLGRD